MLKFYVDFSILQVVDAEAASHDEEYVPANVPLRAKRGGSDAPMDHMHTSDGGLEYPIVSL